MKVAGVGKQGKRINIGEGLSILVPSGHYYFMDETLYVEKPLTKPSNYKEGNFSVDDERKYKYSVSFNILETFEKGKKTKSEFNNFLKKEIDKILKNFSSAIDNANSKDAGKHGKTNIKDNSDGSQTFTFSFAPKFSFDVSPAVIKEGFVFGVLQKNVILFESKTFWPNYLCITAIIDNDTAYLVQSALNLNTCIERKECFDTIKHLLITISSEAGEYVAKSEKEPKKLKLGSYGDKNGKVLAIKALDLFGNDAARFEKPLGYAKDHHKAESIVPVHIIGGDADYSDYHKNSFDIETGMNDLFKVLEANEKLRIPLEKMTPKMKKFNKNHDITGLSLFEFAQWHMLFIMEDKKDSYTVFIEKHITDCLRNYESYVVAILDALRDYNGLTGDYEYLCRRFYNIEIGKNEGRGSIFEDIGVNQLPDGIWGYAGDGGFYGMTDSTDVEKIKNPEKKKVHRGSTKASSRKSPAKTTSEQDSEELKVQNAITKAISKQELTIEEIQEAIKPLKATKTLIKKIINDTPRIVTSSKKVDVKNDNGEVIKETVTAYRKLTVAEFNEKRKAEKLAEEARIKEEERKTAEKAHLQEQRRKEKEAERERIKLEKERALIERVSSVILENLGTESITITELLNKLPAGTISMPSLSNIITKIDGVGKESFIRTTTNNYGLKMERTYNGYYNIATREEEIRIKKEKAAALKRIAEEKERQRRSWIAQGLCQYCGGEFKHKLFSRVCINCGKKKDY